MNIAVVLFQFVSLIMNVYSTVFHVPDHIVVLTTVGGFPTHDHRGVTTVHLTPFAQIFIEVTSQFVIPSVSFAESVRVIGPLILVAGPLILAVPR